MDCLAPLSHQLCVCCLLHRNSIKKHSNIIDVQEHLQLSFAASVQRRFFTMTRVGILDSSSVLVGFCFKHLICVVSALGLVTSICCTEETSGETDEKTWFQMHAEDHHHLYLWKSFFHHLVSLSLCLWFPPSSHCDSLFSWSMNYKSWYEHEAFD